MGVEYKVWTSHLLHQARLPVAGLGCLLRLSCWPSRPCGYPRLMIGQRAVLCKWNRAPFLKTMSTQFIQYPRKSRWVVFLLLFFNVWVDQRSCVCECTSVWKLEGVILCYRSLIGVDWPESPRDAPVSASPAPALRAHTSMLRFFYVGSDDLNSGPHSCRQVLYLLLNLPSLLPLLNWVNSAMALCVFGRDTTRLSAHTLILKLHICWISYVRGRCLFIKDVNCSIKYTDGFHPLCSFPCHLRPETTIKSVLEVRVTKSAGCLLLVLI